MEIYDLDISPRSLPGIRIGNSWISIENEMTDKNEWKIWFDVREGMEYDGSGSVLVEDANDWSPMSAIESAVFEMVKWGMLFASLSRNWEPLETRQVITPPRQLVEWSADNLADMELALYNLSE